jgi:hypothetical protein
MARHAKKERMGSFSELLGDPRWRARAVCGALLAMVGLATFWGAVVAGQDIAADFLKRANDPDWASKSKIAFGFIQTAGAGVGMLAFGPLAARWGCKKTFFIMHLAALVMTFAVCWLPSYFASYVLLLFLLPLFGFFPRAFTPATRFTFQHCSRRTFGQLAPASVSIRAVYLPLPF